MPLSAPTLLISLLAIRLWVPTARLLTTTLTPAPAAMARTVSTMDELPMAALPAATCWTERALAPESIKSMSSPCSWK